MYLIYIYICARSSLQEHDMHQYSFTCSLSRLFERLTACISREISACATTIYSGVVVVWSIRSLLSWLCFLNTVVQPHTMRTDEYYSQFVCIGEFGTSGFDTSDKVNEYIYCKI